MPDEKPEAEVAFLQGIGPAIVEAMKDFHPAQVMEGVQHNIMQMVDGILQARPDDVIEAQPAETHAAPEAGSHDELVAVSNAPSDAGHAADHGSAPPTAPSTGSTSEHGSGQPSDHGPATEHPAEPTHTDGDHSA